jgi:chromosome segregation ATPase
MSDDAQSTLGERLLEGVRNLWRTVNSQGRVLDHHGQEIEALRSRMDSLESDLHSLKTSRGIHRARNQRLEAALQEAEGKLSEVRRRLDG